MNEKLKSEITQLGLPPMELAETSVKGRNSNTSNCFYSFISKVAAIFMSILLVTGCYVIVLRVLDADLKTTDVIIVTSAFQTPNIPDETAQLVIEVRNKTFSQIKPRNKRSILESNESKSTSSENSQSIEDIVSNFSDEDRRKARDVIANHNEPCDNENKNEFCKDLVDKLKYIPKMQTRQVPPEKEAISSNIDIENKNKIVWKEIKDESLENSRSAALSMEPDKKVYRHFDERDYEPGYGETSLPNYPEHPLRSPSIIQPSELSKTCLLARLLKNNYPQQGYSNHFFPEYYAPHYEHEPLPYSRYPHLPVLPYPQSRDVEIENLRLHEQDEEIFRKHLDGATGMIFDPKDCPCKTFNATTRESECDIGTLPCDSGDQCVTGKQWCDGKIDCSDMSDEKRCSCKDRIDKSRLCDGYFDCPFGEDEMGCFGCREDTFSCVDLDINSESTCFSKEQRCNNIIDCPNRKDELECNMLAPTLHEKPLFAISNTEGFLHRNFKGIWYPVCKNPYMFAHDACRRETGLIIRPPFLQIVQVDPTKKLTYLNTGPGGMLYKTDTCFNSTAVYVTCPDLLCGTRVLSTTQLLRENVALENHLFGRNKRFSVKHQPYPFVFYNGRIKRGISNNENNTESIEVVHSDHTNTDVTDRSKRTETRVVGGNPSQPAAWPWMAALYRDGMFHCGGVILTQNYILSAAHCVSKFWEHYFEVVVGMLRRFSFSPQEQNVRVTHIIVNQNYDKVDMKNDLSLLRVAPVILFSRWVRPICLPGPETAGSDWMWGPPPGTMCYAVGWGATKEHGPDPDHIREVEVPIWSRCKHEEDQQGKEICAGFIEGGKDACQGDSGGPLLCRNPLNSQQWFMAGIVSHGDGCGRRDEPGVYTRVSLFIKWIRFHIFSKNLPTIQPKQECPGFKCLSGISKCLPKSRICDKIIDCLGGEDENNCESSKESHIFGDNLFLSATHENLLDNKDTQETRDSELQSRDSETENSLFITATDKTEANTKVNDVEESVHKKTAKSEEFLEINTDEKQQFRDDNRGDIHAIELTLQKNELESRSSTLLQNHTIENEKSSHDSDNSKIGNMKDADINDDWEDTETENDSDMHFIDKSDTTTQKENRDLISEMETSNQFEDKNDDTKIKDPSSIEKDSEKQSKQILVELLPINDPNDENVLILEQNHSQNHHKKLILPQTEHSTTTLKSTQSFDNRQDIIKKMEDIVVSEFQLAKTRRRHHTPKEFDCRRIKQKIDYNLRCNHNADCEDGTDEMGCACLDYLAAFDHKLICDGIYDCANGQDEADCYDCNEDHFLCKRSKICLPMDLVCDGKAHCPQGEDEIDCYTLSNGQEVANDQTGRPKISMEGFITKRHSDDWHIVCEDNLSIEQQENAAHHICRYLGFSSANRYLIKYINIKDELLTDNGRSRREISDTSPITFSYRKVSGGNEKQMTIKNPQMVKEQCIPNIKKTCMSLYVFCDHALFTEFDTPQELLFSRAVDISSSKQIFPWIAKVFVEGEYRCTGVLIDVSWVLVSHSCLWDSLLNYHHITVVLGSHRTLHSVTGPYEQIHKIDAKKDVYNSKVTMLHLKTAIEHSNMVKPMVVHSHTSEENSNKICVAVGQDEKNNTISLFLEETTENCVPYNRCFLRQPNATICSTKTPLNRPWAGIISCHTEQGWFPAATFLERKGECDSDNMFIGSDIYNLKSELKQFIGRAASDVSEVEETCDGERCARGRCIKMQQVCDGVNHCEDGNDESPAACEKKNKICTKDAYRSGCECKTGEFKCRNGKCVAKELFRNGRNDCGDGTDEPGDYTCSDYLSKVMPSRLCDGLLHCHDRSDEDPMYCKCFAKKNFQCGSNDNHCVAPDMVCDGIRDCPKGEDETTCIGLSSLEGTPYGIGEVIVRSHGVWLSKCYPTTKHTKSELEGICRELGFLSGHAKQLPATTKSIFNSKTKLVLDHFNDVILNNNTMIKLRNSDTPIARTVLDENLTNCYPLFIECV